MRRTIAVIALTLLSTPLFAQKAAEVTIQQVNDRRTKGSFSHLTIALELPKVRNAEVAASRVLVTSAVDDSGASLLETGASEPQLETNYRMSMATDDAAAPALVSLALKNPDRKATKVKEVRGEIELYMPSKDANSVAEIAKFQSSTGKTLSHKALKANGVEIALISPAQLDAERKRLGEAKRAEYKASGFEGEELDNIVKSYVESLITVDEGDIVTRIKDPNNRIHEIAFVDAAGEEKRVSMSDREGFTMLSQWGGKPQADWKLRVSMKTAKNLVRQTFAVTNVPLP